MHVTIDYCYFSMGIFLMQKCYLNDRIPFFFFFGISKNKNCNKIKTINIAIHTFCVSNREGKGIPQQKYKIVDAIS